MIYYDVLVGSSRFVTVQLQQTFHGEKQNLISQIVLWKL